MKEIYGHEMPPWMKMLGAWRVNKDSIDFNWGYFAPRFGFELMLDRGGYFDQRYALTICLLWGVWLIHLPFKTKIPESCDTPRYGIQIHSNTVWIHCGGKMNGWHQCDSKWLTCDIPFITMIFDSHEVEDKNGNWVPFVGSWENKTHDGRYTETHSYKYPLKSGEVQERNATIFKERRNYHYKWLPFLKKTFTCIDVEFDDEVGERSGSWKGGCVGCGYDILPGETILQCLRRMEKERKF